MTDEGSKPTKGERLTTRLSEEELAELDAVAEEERRSRADTVRLLIHRAYVALPVRRNKK